MGLLCDESILGRVVDRHGETQNIAPLGCLDKVWRKGGCVENFLAYFSNDQSRSPFLSEGFDF